MSNLIKGFDVVEKPKHYTDRKVEVIDYIKDNMTKEQYKGYLEGNVIKYISRHKVKNGIEDLKKAKWYLDKLIEQNTDTRTCPSCESKQDAEYGRCLNCGYDFNREVAK